jgi:hypothetical protein
MHASLPGRWLTSIGAIATDQERTERVQLVSARLKRKLARRTALFGRTKIHEA